MTVTAGQLLLGRKTWWQSSIKRLMEYPDISYPLLKDDRENPLLKSYTSDNSVTALVDGKEYMKTC